jgi:hypothetical protein
MNTEKGFVGGGLDVVMALGGGGGWNGLADATDEAAAAAIPFAVPSWRHRCGCGGGRCRYKTHWTKVCDEWRM